MRFPRMLSLALMALTAAACQAPGPGGAPGFALAPEATEAEAGYQLLATPLRFATATASVAASLAPRAIDGDLATCWKTTARSASLTLGLGAVTDLSALALKVSPGAGPYNIRVSRDGSTWTTVRTGRTNTTWNLETKTLPAGTRAKLVRLVFTAPGPEICVFEAQAVPAAAASPTPTPVVTATPAPVATATPAPAATATPAPVATASPVVTAPGRGFPAGAPWVACYGTARQMGDLTKMADTFRVIDVDADPGCGNLTAAQIAQLKAGGRNRVLSYLNLGSCESWRDYWTTAPAGLVPAGKNTAAHMGAYDGYPDETWMDLANPAWQQLVLDHIAPRLVAQGVDGFYFDNLELVEHSNPATSQGGLDLVYKLRQKFPQALFVMQNATSDVTRLGTTHGVPYASLLDGIAHEEVYGPTYDAWAEAELIRWRGMDLTPGGRPFWIATEDYVGSATSTTQALSCYTKSRAQGFSPYVSDASASMSQVFYWGF